MKISAWVSLGFVILCMGCSAIEAEDQKVDSRRFSGKLILLVADNFEKQTSQILYELLSDEDGRTYALYFPDKIDMTDIKNGTHVEIYGRQNNGRIKVDTLKILTSPEGKN